MFIISDIHGCFQTLLNLLGRLPKDEKVCLVGDLGDRGPQSAHVIDFVMRNNIDCVMGNHEDLMLKAFSTSSGPYSFGRTDAMGLWIQNGGGQTLESYKDKKVRVDHLDWIKELPRYIIYDDIVDSEGRKLFISHAGISRFAPNLQDAIDNDDIMWHRDKLHVPDGLFSVVGHTPKDGPIIKEDHAYIDTGCVCTPSAYGKLTALRFPQMEIIQEKRCDDSRVWLSK